MARDGTSLKARAIVFALAAGAVAFILSVLPNLGHAQDIGIVWRAVIPAVVVAAMCWAAAERAIAATAEAIDAAIERLSRAARGDLNSAIPAQIGICVPPLAAAMDDLFLQLNASMSSIERMALFDTVTGLPNRNHFRSRCEVLVGEVSGTGGGALLFIDLDRFKAVNDTLGHASGDQLLAQVAQRMRAVVEETAPPGGKAPLIGRLAGDEFTVFLPCVAESGEPDRVGRAIQAALARTFDIDGHAIEIGASIGIAMCPQHGETITDLMKAADSAMYHAKAGGRGLVERYGPALADRISARAVLDEELRHAIAQDQFTLVYQPQIASFDGRLVGAEALLRWRHPTRGMILPAAFIERAEENGAIVEIGRWAVDAVAATIGRWGPAGGMQRLSISLSRRQIDPADFFQRLHDALAATGAPAGLLEVQMTEPMAMRCSDHALTALADLRAAGASIALKDFGTGYSDLARLRAMPLDRIKLDPGVMANVLENEQARMIAQALVGLVHGLGCEAVAEGIESRAQAEVLRMIGCDAVQGLATAEPMDEDRFLVWAGADAARAAQPSARFSTAA